MSDTRTGGIPPLTYSEIFAPPNAGSGTQLNDSSRSAKNSKRNADAIIDEASVFLNQDGSVTVTNLRDNRGSFHTVYIPFYCKTRPGQAMVTLIDGVPLNPISQEHLWLSHRARAIGVDTQLRACLKDLPVHESQALEAMASAIIGGQMEKARQIFRSFRHTKNASNNFYKLVRPLTTLLMILKTPEGYLLDPSRAQIGVNYSGSATGAVLSIYNGRQSIHLWNS